MGCGSSYSPIAAHSLPLVTIAARLNDWLYGLSSGGLGTSSFFNNLGTKIMATTIRAANKRPSNNFLENDLLELKEENSYIL